MDHGVSFDTHKGLPIFNWKVTYVLEQDFTVVGISLILASIPLMLCGLYSGEGYTPECFILTRVLYILQIKE